MRQLREPDIEGRCCRPPAPGKRRTFPCGWIPRLRAKRRRRCVAPIVLLFLRALQRAFNSKSIERKTGGKRFGPFRGDWKRRGELVSGKQITGSFNICSCLQLFALDSLRHARLRAVPRTNNIDRVTSSANRFTRRNDHV